MKNNKGFVSTSIVITIIMLVSAIILLVLAKYDNTKDLTDMVASDAKARLLSANSPNCSWGTTPFLKTTNDGDDKGTVILTCSHISGIKTNLQEELKTENIYQYISVLNENQQPTPNLNVSVVKVALTMSGYKVILELESNIAGRYFLSLNENEICTFKEKCNQKIISKIIMVEE